MTYFPNVDPIYLYKRNEDEYITLEQTITVKNARVTLKEIPDYNSSFSVKKSDGTALTKVTSPPTTSTQYQVDYSTGTVFFVNSLNDTELTFNYTGTGQVNIGANRIIINTSETNNEEVTVQDVLDAHEDIKDFKTLIDDNQVVTLTEYNYLKDTTYQAPKEFTWVSTANQDIFVINNGIFTEKSLIDLSIGNVPQSSDNFTLVNNTTIKLPTPLPSNIKVYVKWSEGKKVVNNSVDVTDVYSEINGTKNSIVQVNEQLATMMTQTEFDSWVATILDGGPSIFFDTYSQLVATYPNGAAGVALVRETDPSHIYVWNPINNSWQDYGEYQGLEPKDGTIAAKKTNFITPKVINIFDPTTAVEGAYIGSDGVTITTNTKYGYSAYIPVYKGESITLADSDPAILVHLYDSSKNKIQTITGVADDTVITPKTITISVDGFIRFNYNKSIISKENYTVLVTRYDEFEIPNLKVTQSNLPENVATTENVNSTVDNAIANLYNSETFERMYSYEGKPASTNDQLFIEFLYDLSGLTFTAGTQFKAEYKYYTEDTNLINVGFDVWMNNNSAVGAVSGGYALISNRSNPITYNETVQYSGSAGAYPSTVYSYAHVLLVMKRNVLDHANIMKFADFNFYIGDTLIPLEKLVSVNPVLQQSGYVFEQIDGWSEYLITSSQFNKKTKTIELEINQINNTIDGLNVLSPWYAKKVGIVGDSISADATQAKKWHRFIGEKLNWTIENQSIAGTGYLKNTNAWSRVDLLSTDCDLIIIFLGTNDALQNSTEGVPLGQSGSDTSTFYGAVEYTLYRARRRFPTKTILVMTPLPRWDMDKVNDQGLTLKDYVEPIRATAKKESMHLLDLFNESCFFAKEETFKTTYTNNSDGLHPNEPWQEILGLRKVLPKLNTM